MWVSLEMSSTTWSADTKIELLSSSCYIFHSQTLMFCDLLGQRTNLAPNRVGISPFCGLQYRSSSRIPDWRVCSECVVELVFSGATIYSEWYWKKVRIVMSCLQLLQTEWVDVRHTDSHNKSVNSSRTSGLCNLRCMNSGTRQNVHVSGMCRSPAGACLHQRWRLEQSHCRVPFKVVLDAKRPTPRGNQGRNRLSVMAKVCAYGDTASRDIVIRGP